MMITKSTKQQPDDEPVADSCSTTDPTASEHVSIEENANTTH